MRFLLQRASSNHLSGQSMLGFRSFGEGRTLGIIGAVSTECPATILVTSSGTLLIATGYGPMLRMRQNERELLSAGVPSPKQAIIIVDPATEAGAGSPVDNGQRLVHFDYSAQGDLYAIGAQLIPASGLLALQVGYKKVTEEGKASQTLRDADFLKYVGKAVAIGSENATETYRRVHDVFLGTTWRRADGSVVATTSPPQPVLLGDTVKWNHTIFDLLVQDTTTDSNGNRIGNIDGRYQAFYRYVDKDGNVSNPSPMSGDVVIDAANSIVYRNFEPITDQRIVKRQIFRNTNGQADVFYLDIESDDLTATEFTSYTTDEQLKLSTPLPLFDNDGFSNAYLYGEPPSDKPFIAEFNDRIWAVGYIIYKTGHLEVTNGATTLQGVGTNLNGSMAGWELVAAGQTYQILTVDEAAQTFVLTKPYQGPDDNYVSYAIRPFRGDANLLRYSLAGFPEAWGIEFAFGLPQDNDDYTGLVNFANALYILKTRHIYRIAQGADPLRDAEIKPIAHRGCVNQRCAVSVEGMCFMLDRQGIHAFDGSSEPQQTSIPIADLFRLETEWLRVNWDADTCWWHAVHMEEMGIIRWYVAMSGSDLPRHAICLDYRKNRWWIEEFPFAITSSTVSNGILGRPILGSEDGRLLTSDIGPLDMVATTDGNTRLTVDETPGEYSVIVNEAPATTGIGTTVSVVSGPGRGQWRIISDIVDNEITVDEPWLVFPTEDSVLQIGGIPYTLQTGDYNSVKLEIDSPKSIVLKYTVSPESLDAYVTVFKNGKDVRTTTIFAYWGALYSDPDDPLVKRIDLSSDLGYVADNFDHQYEQDIPARSSTMMLLVGFSGEAKPRFTELYLVGASQEQGP